LELETEVKWFIQNTFVRTLVISMAIKIATTII